MHLGANPFGGTYLRRYEGDYQADDETVRRMLAERVEDSRDERVLKGFDLADLDLDTVAAYRNRFAVLKPGHVWADLPVAEFLERIGAFGRNREEGYAGPRLAGLLMFGRAEVISDALPNYMLDYQERPEPQDERRWVDRLVPDGSWSGNVYDFFRRVYQKLTVDLKVPFQLRDGQRVEDTPVHEALREALVNTLVHADFSGRMSVLVIKRPDMFGFRNPGLMRVAPELAVQGGHSDCRNRRLQHMFRLVGYGDQAGSGLPKIFRNWAGQHWRRPSLHELREPEQTQMELRMSSLVPAQTLTDLESHLGARFRALPELARLALITASAEGLVDHARLREVSTVHPADITKMLAGLVRDGLLVSSGVGRGTVYFLPWQKSHPGALFGMALPEAATKAAEPLTPASADLFPRHGGKPPGLGAQPPELIDKPPQLEAKPPQLEAQAADPGAKPPVPTSVYLEWGELPVSLQETLLAIAHAVSRRRWVPAPVMQDTVRRLCEGRFLGRKVLAQLLSRNPDDLLKRTLNPMVQAQELVLAFPSISDPRQAYTTNIHKPTSTAEE